MSNKLIYLIVGDGFMRREEYEVLLPKLKKILPDNIEIQNFDITDNSMNEILGCARSLPFLVEGQILRIKQVDKLKEEGVLELETYLKKPFSQSILVLEADKVEDRSKLAKLVSKYGQVIRPIQANRMKKEVQFLKAKLTEARKTITPGAQKTIFEMCGESPVFLATMVDRLILFAGDKDKIDETMVQQFDEDWSEVRIFDLSNAIIEKNPSKALHVLNKLFEMDDNIYSLLGFIHSQVKKLWQAKILMGEGLVSSQVAARLGMKSSYVAGNFFRGLQKFELNKIESAIDELHQLDIGSKTGRVVAKPTLEMWMLKLTAPATSPLQGQRRGRS